jgi:type IV secretory pathway TrbD component
MLRGTPSHFYQSLNRPFKIMGVERQLFFLILGITTPIAVAGQFSPQTDLVAFLLFIFGHIIGLLITRADPQMLGIYRRHIRYHRFYCSNAKINSIIAPIIPASVPIFQGQKGLV